jgi:hypothetical protein
MGDGVVESAYSGTVTPEELRHAVLSAVALARESGVWRFYTDVTGLAGGHSTGDLFAIISLLDQMGLPRTLREALFVLPSTAAATDVQFWEDAARNRGWYMRLFAERERALEWLLAP